MFAKPMELDSPLSDWVESNYHNSYKETELFGVEVELEGTGGITNPTPAVFAKWMPHNDGSLRKLAPGDEAIEYVLRYPLNRADTLLAVKELCEFLGSPGKKVYESYRTSIHVHVNCLADKMRHVYNFITLCILFDELFCTQAGDHRIGNNFCLRARDAQGQVMELIDCINTFGSISHLSQQNRYSSINFVSLLKFGTIEFRSLECTTDAFRIAHWIRTIDALKQSSRMFEDPQDIIRKFSQWSMDDFMIKVLGPQALLYQKVPGYQNILFNGMRLAQDFAFCSKWIPVGEAELLKEKEKKVFQQKKIEAQLAAYVAGDDHIAPPNWVLYQPAEPQPVPADEGPDYDDDDNDDDLDFFLDELDDE